MTVGQSASEQAVASHDSDLWITVVVDGVPILYPQAARVLCRIVVRLARAERAAEGAPRAEENAS